MISELTNIAFSAFNQLLQTITEQVLVFFDAFKHHCSYLLLQDIDDVDFLNAFNTAFDNLLNAWLTVVKEFIEDYPDWFYSYNLVSIIEDLFTWVPLDDFQYMSQSVELMWALLFACLHSLEDTILSFFPNLFYDIMNYALEFGQVIVDALAGISGSLQN